MFKEKETEIKTNKIAAESLIIIGWMIKYENF